MKLFINAYVNFFVYVGGMRYCKMTTLLGTEDACINYINELENDAID